MLIFRGGLLVSSFSILLVPASLFSIHKSRRDLYSKNLIAFYQQCTVSDLSNYSQISIRYGSVNPPLRPTYSGSLSLSWHDKPSVRHFVGNQCAVNIHHMQLTYTNCPYFSFDCTDSDKTINYKIFGSLSF